MATKKEEPKYIGRYGEVLKNVKCIEPDCYRDGSEAELGKGTHMQMHGEGARTRNGMDGDVYFLISKKTGKKDGYYRVWSVLNEKQWETFGRKTARYVEYHEDCSFLNDVLHGKETHYFECHAGDLVDMPVLDGTQFEKTWYKGKEVSEKREEKGKEAKSLRQLFSLFSVQKAVKTGDIIKVKSAITRALKKQMDRGE